MLSWLKITQAKRSNQKGKRMHQSCLDQKCFPRTAQYVNLLERIFGNLHGICWVCRYSVGNIKTDDCLNDNKSVTRLFQTKAIPPSLRNACEYVLQFNFKITHIAVSVNTAADFLSRLELKVTEKIHLKIREDVQTTNNTHRGVNIFLRCCRWKTVLLRANKWSKWNWWTDPTTQRAISEKGNRIGSGSGTILNETKYRRIHKNRGKHYVVFHQRK